MAHRGRERGRLKIQWIMDSTKRKKALNRRLPSLLKKVRELSVLCDTPACLLVYLPDAARPVVWPSRKAAKEVLRRYRDLLLGRLKNKLDGLEYLEQMNQNMRVSVYKVQLQTRDEEIKLVLHDFLIGRRKSFDDLPADLAFFDSMASTVETMLDVVKERLRELRLGGASCPPAAEDIPILVQPPVPRLMVATPLPPQNDGLTSLTLGSEPHHGSYLFQTLDAFSDEEMYAYLVHAGISSQPLLLNPRFLDL